MNIAFSQYTLSAIKNIGTPKCPDNIKDFVYQMFLTHPDISIERIRFIWNAIQECDINYDGPT